jgi:predicted permease
MGFWEHEAECERGDEDLEAEIAAHLRMAEQDRIDRGESPDAARAEALKEFGNVALVLDVSASMMGNLWWLRAVRDMRFAVRQIRRAPSFSIAVIAVLALGIAAPTVMFTIAEQTLLRDVPYRDADRLVKIEKQPGINPSISAVTFADLKILQDRFSTIGPLGFATDDHHAFFLQGASKTIQVSAPRVSKNFFSILLADPEIGHRFESSQPAWAGNEIMLSDEIWRDVFHRDPTIVGQKVSLSGHSYFVTGVMPNDFRFPLGVPGAQVWTSDISLDSFPSKPYTVLARLPDGIKRSALQRNLDQISSSEAPRRDHVFTLEIFTNSIVSKGLRHGLLALFAASMLLWLITCTNASGLFLTRAIARQKELAIRQALGASRQRIIWQLFIEGLIISLIAAMLGIIFSLLAIALSKGLLSAFLQTSISLLPSLRLLVFLSALVILSALVCSVLASFDLSDSTLLTRMLGKSRMRGREKTQHQRRLLIVSQIALSLAMVVACGLLLRTVHALRNAPLGFQPAHVIVANLKMPAYRFKESDIASSVLDPMVSHLGTMPGVEGATLISDAPLGKNYNITLLYDSTTEGSSGVSKNLSAHLRALGPEAQSVFAFTILHGRFFDRQDTKRSPFVLVVNKTFARRFLGRDSELQNMIGVRLLNDGPRRSGEVIGVVEDTPFNNIDSPSEPEIDICTSQIDFHSRFYSAVYQFATSVAIKTHQSPALMIPLIDAAISKDAPLISRTSITSMDQVIEDSYRNELLGSKLTTLFALVALLLAATGLYGLITYLVVRKSKELGVRMALGATSDHIIFMVMKEGLPLVVIGVMIGNFLTIASIQLLRSFLFGVQPYDILTLCGANALLIVTGMCAAFIPARRATKLDISKVLRLN